MDPKHPLDSGYAARLSRAVQETVAAQLALARHSADLARSTAARDMSGATAAREYLEAVAAEGVRLGTQTVDLGRLYLERVAEVGASLSSSVFRARKTTERDEHKARDTRNPPPADHVVKHSERSQSSGAAETPAKASGSVALRGPIGGTAEGSVVVANRHPRKRVVHLAADRLCTATGARSPAVLAIEPKRFTVPAGAEHTFRLSVQLRQAEVTSGSILTGALRISGADEATVDVTVRVD